MDTTTDPTPAPDRDVPDRDVPDRNGPDRDVPDRDGPDRDPDAAPQSDVAATQPRSGTAEVGDHGETLAAEHLQSLGMEVVARNWRVSTGDLRGELDLVALDHESGCVVVVEVKTRRGAGWGGPLAAIDGRKQARLRRLARAFMTQSDLPYRRSRIDVIGVRLDTRHLHHVTHAL